MTDTNFRSSDPTNKSSDNLEEKNTHINNLINQLENSKNQLEKVCFNPYCNDKGNRWIDIVGTPVGVRDNEIPYCLCDECYSCIVRKLTESEEIDSNHDYYLVGRRLVGELHELATYATNDESFNSMPKVCYKNSCKNEGKHWIRVSVRQMKRSLLLCSLKCRIGCVTSVMNSLRTGEKAVLSMQKYF
jgi:hypothetical protein